jgi:4-hydroxybutyrate CoA-transferase
MSEIAGLITSRYDVHYVVSVYGVAHLHARTLSQRARARIAIAHPDFRPMLTKAARELHYL